MVILYCAVVRGAERAFPLYIDVGLSVGHLKEAIKEKKKFQFPADQLQLFLAKKADEWLSREDVNNTDGLTRLAAARAEIGDVGLSEEDVRIEKEHGATAETTPVHVLVVVPSSEVGSKRPANDKAAEVWKRLKTMEVYLKAIKTKRTLTTVHLSVSEDEFRLDSLFEKQRSARPIVDTPGLHAFWEDFGEFPPYYFVRMEEVVFWEVIKKLIFVKVRVVIVGSPGVGKSCFLTLIAFYLACIEKRKVLLIRCLKTSDLANVVVFFDGQGSYARLTNLSLDDLSAIRSQTQGAIVLVDGFNQAEMSPGMEPFHFLATWHQFRQDSDSRIVVLPAWRFADLLQYAKLTNWVMETGLHTTKRLAASTWRKIVKEQYFYSGGSLRQFCQNRRMLEKRIWIDCAAVRRIQAFQLMYSFGAAETVDRIWRHYITDCRTENHYLDCRWWTLSVDSGYALSQLGGIVDTEKQLEAYQYAKSLGAVFHGFAYKVLLHNAVQGAFAKRESIVLKTRKGSKYEKIEIRVPRVVCEGDDEAACFSCLSSLGEDTYWRPSYPFFPYIDAVTTCEAFPSGSKDSETIVAYIQVATQSEKKFKEQRLRRLNEEMDKNQSLKDMKRAFVVVSPDARVCETFTLHGAPDPNTVLAVVSCFDPGQLKLEARWHM